MRTGCEMGHAERGKGGFVRHCSPRCYVIGEGLTWKCVWVFALALDAHAASWPPWSPPHAAATQGGLWTTGSSGPAVLCSLRTTWRCG